MYITTEPMKAFFYICQEGNIKLSLSPTKNILYLPVGSLLRKNDEDNSYSFVQKPKNIILHGKDTENKALIYRLSNSILQHRISVPEFNPDKTAHITTLQELIDTYKHYQQTLDSWAQDTLPHTSALLILSKLRQAINSQPTHILEHFNSSIHKLQQHDTSPSDKTNTDLLEKAVKQAGILPIHAGTENMPGLKIKEAAPQILYRLYRTYGDDLIEAIKHSGTSILSENANKRHRENEKKANQELIHILESSKRDKGESLSRLPLARKEDITKFQEDRKLIPATWGKINKIMKYLYNKTGRNPWEEVVHSIVEPTPIHMYKIHVPESKTVTSGDHDKHGNLIVENTIQVPSPTLQSLTPEEIKSLQEYHYNLGDTHPFIDLPSTERFGSASHTNAHAGQNIYPHIISSPPEAVAKYAPIILTRALQMHRNFPSLSRYLLAGFNPSSESNRQGILLSKEGKYEKIFPEREGVSLEKERKKQLDIDTLLAERDGKRVKEHVKDALYDAFDKIKNGNDPEKDYKKRLIAATLLQVHAGVRPGRNENTNNTREVKKYGSLYLLGNHVSFSGNKNSRIVNIKFNGKNNVEQHIQIRDPKMYEILYEMKKDSDKLKKHYQKLDPSIQDFNLFPGLRLRESHELRETLKDILKPELEKRKLQFEDNIYDKVLTDPYAYRRAHFNLLLRNIAHEAGKRLKANHMASNSTGVTQQEFQDTRNKVFNLVSIFSGNRGETLDKSYILPGTFSNAFYTGYTSDDISPSQEKLSEQHIKQIPYAKEQESHEDNRLNSEDLNSLSATDDQLDTPDEDSSDFEDTSDKTK